MTTSSIPTRSGDGAFVLEFDLLQYTLVADDFSERSATILGAKIGSEAARPHPHLEREEKSVAKANGKLNSS
jgi:hypothetical protein